MAFCFKCGKQLRDDELFCSGCGTKVPVEARNGNTDAVPRGSQPVPAAAPQTMQQTPAAAPKAVQQPGTVPPQVMQQPAAVPQQVMQQPAAVPPQFAQPVPSAPAEPKRNTKKIILITVISILLLAAIGTGLYFALRKDEPEEKESETEQIVKAFRNTLKAESFAFSLTLKLDDEKNNLDGMLLGNKETNQLYMVVERKDYYDGYPIKYDMEVAYDDGRLLMRGLMNGEAEDIYDEETDRESLKFAEKLCQKDYLGAVMAISDFEYSVKKLCGNYDELEDILTAILKDCLASEDEQPDFLKSCKKKKDTYSFVFDLSKLVQAAKDDYGMEISNSDCKELLREIEKEKLGNLEVSFTIADGYLQSLSGEIDIDDEPAGIEITFSDFNKIDAEKSKAATVAADIVKHLDDPEEGRITPTPTPEDDTVTLHMWCNVTESDSYRHAFELAIREMESVYPNVRLYWEAFEYTSYREKMKAASASGELPDIFLSFGGNGWEGYCIRDLVAQNRLYCLDDVYAGYTGDLPEKMCRNAIVDGQVYGVPLNMNAVCLFANMDILQSVGYTKIPSTIDELMDCCELLVRNGYTPFALGGKEEWCVSEYLESIIEKTCGAKTLDAIFRGETDWYNGDVAGAVNLFREMIDKGYFGRDFIALRNDEAKACFMYGQFAFYVNGSWNCVDCTKSDYNIQVAEFPLINPRKAGYGQLIGGVSEFFTVSSGSEHADLAAKYVYELTKRINKYVYLDGCGLPSWSIDYDDSAVDPLLRAVAEMVAKSDYMVLYGDTQLDSKTLESYYSKYHHILYENDYDGIRFVTDMNRPDIPDQPLDVFEYGQ